MGNQLHSHLEHCVLSPTLGKERPPWAETPGTAYSIARMTLVRKVGSIDEKDVLPAVSDFRRDSIRVFVENYAISNAQRS